MENPGHIMTVGVLLWYCFVFWPVALVSAVWSAIQATSDRSLER